MQTIHQYEYMRQDTEMVTEAFDPNFFNDYTGMRYLQNQIKKFKKDQIGQAIDYIPIGIADMEANFISMPIVSCLNWIENLVTQSYEFLIVGLEYSEPPFFEYD